MITNLALIGNTAVADENKPDEKRYMRTTQNFT